MEEETKCYGVSTIETVELDVQKKGLSDDIGLTEMAANIDANADDQPVDLSAANQDTIEANRGEVKVDGVTTPILSDVVTSGRNVSLDIQAPATAREPVSRDVNDTI